MKRSSPRFTECCRIRNFEKGYGRQPRRCVEHFAWRHAATIQIVLTKLKDQITRRKLDHYASRKDRFIARASARRCLARDYERLPETGTGLHFVILAMLMFVHAVPLFQDSWHALTLLVKSAQARRVSNLRHAARNVPPVVTFTAGRASFTASMYATNTENHLERLTSSSDQADRR